MISNQKKIIYLTFDDGIQPGTKEVLDILAIFSIRATFFLTGLHTQYTLERTPEMVIGCLKQMLFQKHCIGNHSYSHCHGFYKNYYAKGLLLNPSGSRMSILNDFKKNHCFFQNLCKDNSISTPFPLEKIARLPGRNSWYVKKKLSCINSPIRLMTGRDTIHAITDLAVNNFSIFGWDEEWHMNFDFAKEIENLKTKHLNTLNYYEPEIIYPNIDYMNSDNLFKDRPNESRHIIINKILSNKEDKIVVLMHDRAFRPNNKSTNNEALQLKILLEDLISNNCVFDTVYNY